LSQVRDTRQNTSGQCSRLSDCGNFKRTFSHSSPNLAHEEIIMNRQRIRPANAFSFGMLLLLPALFAGCNQSHPGNWDETTVESKLKEKMNLTSLDLTPAEGGYNGSGADSEGETYQFVVEQNAANKELTYVAEGDRGTIEEGSIAFD
jgi:hypothetical protein